MPPVDDFDAPELTRRLLRCRRQGALATLMPNSGAPYCSLVNVATHFDGSPILLISRLAIHTQNLLADPRVSLMLDERAAGDPLEGSRITAAGTVMLGEGDDLAVLRRRYLNAHPGAESFADFADFSFFRIHIESVHLVAGFGRIVDLAAPQVLTDLNGCEALLAAEPEIIEHMNAEHLDAMNLYAVALLGAADGAWRCTGCDPDGIDLGDDNQSVRLAFPHRATNPLSLRAMLRDLATQARSANSLN